MAKKKNNEKTLIIRIILSLLLILIVAASIKIYEDVLAGNVRPEANNSFLYYHTRLSFDENFEDIRNQHILKNTRSLKRMISLFGYKDMLKPGRYRITDQNNNLDLMRMLVSGRQESMDIVFKYAERKNDLAAFWAKQLEADSSEILRLLNNPAMMDSIGFDTAQSILLFIPNTYNFYWNTSADKLLARMINEYKVFWDLTKTESAKTLALKRSEVGILASIVQKETAKVDEMPLVAGVYYNRLKRGIPLQADPTIIYAMNDKSIRRVGGEMLEIPSPYNTYRNKGLPPGPICVPSVQAIQAVLNPVKHHYIYFCAKEDFSGYHNFSVTFEQHLACARRYQRELNKRAIR